MDRGAWWVIDHGVTESAMTSQLNNNKPERIFACISSPFSIFGFNGRVMLAS